MPFSTEDKALAKNLYAIPVQKIQFVENCVKFFKDKQQKGWTGHVAKRFWKTESTGQKQESSILQHAGTEENVTTLDEQVDLLNNEGQKQTHL